MAVLLNPNAHGHGREQTPQVAMDPGAVCLSQPPPQPPSMIPGTDMTGAVIPVPDILSREKKHACTMCHKRLVLRLQKLL
jgi:hypothetical protein